MTNGIPFDDAISAIQVALLITHGADSLIQARPLTTQATSYDGAIWFFSVTNSDAAADICQNPAVLLCYGDAITQRFIASSGVASLSQNRPLMEQLWNPAFAAVFPQGLDDPLLTLLRIDIRQIDLRDADVPNANLMWRMPGTATGINTKNFADNSH
ncbi:MAG: general stress protein 26 [Bradyrhizobium sp.]|jgi:general stress protein 26